MIRLGFIDDRDDELETYGTIIERQLKRVDPEATVLAHLPLDEMSEYVEFLKDTGIDVLILDERLFESASRVGYSGSELAAYLHRERGMLIPIAVLTSHVADVQDASEAAQTDFLIGKLEFQKGAQGEIDVTRLYRAGSRYRKEVDATHLRMSELASKSADGSASTEEVAELKMLQDRVAQHYSPTLVQRNGILDEIQEVVEQIEKIYLARQTKAK